jgi:hypothetical protein
MRQYFAYGYVRGTVGDSRPYRDSQRSLPSNFDKLR